MTHQPMKRLLNSLSPVCALALVAAAGMALCAGGCGRRASKSVQPNTTPAPARLAMATDEAYEPTDRGQAIDTSLAQLAKGGQGEAKLAVTPDEIVLDEGDAQIASRIDQSARILDDYFEQVAAGGDRAYDASLEAAYDPAGAVGSDAERAMIDARFAQKARRPVATVDGVDVNTGLGALAGRTMPTPPVVPPHIESPALAAASGGIPAAAVPHSQAQVAAHVPDEFDALVNKSLDASARLGLGGMATASASAATTDATDTVGAIAPAATAVAASIPVVQGSMQPVEVYQPLPTIGSDPALAAAAAPAAAATIAPPPGPSLVAHRGVTPEQRKDALVDELISILNEMAKTSDEPYRVGLALAGLETLSPDALGDIKRAGLLMPSESEVLLAARDMFRGLVEAGATADAGRALDVLDTVHDRLNESAPLKISSASLCTRVSGYGQFQTFPENSDGSYDFVAGRRQPIIVYVEVDRFGRTPVVGRDGTQQWDVALTQELQIYHAGDNLLVTSRPAEQDHTVSRTKMRDYYLINQTYLPETLGVGRYHLKVVMRDEHKNAVAERIIPFQIVAQPTIRVGMGS